jgi:hypothetical protein
MLVVSIFFSESGLVHVSDPFLRQRQGLQVTEYYLILKGFI